MKKNDLVKETIYIITEYYNGNLQPYFDSLAENILWIGPRKGQILEGKETILSAWKAAEGHNLTFTMGTIAGRSVSTGAGNLEVLLEYYVYTHFPDAATDKHRQRLHCSWGIKKENGEKIPKVFMIHISNIADTEDALSATDNRAVKIYASSFADSNLDNTRTIDRLSKIHFRTSYGKGAREITWFFNSATILWIESADEGRHSVVHALDGNYRAMEKLSFFEKSFDDLLIRIHTSYLVNPMYVKSVTRFLVTLTDGTSLPIPEKRYREVKDMLYERMRV